MGHYIVEATTSHYRANYKKPLAALMICTEKAILMGRAYRVLEYNDLQDRETEIYRYDPTEAL